MSETILLVDDDIRVVSALQRALYKEYRIEIAGSGTDALKALEGTQYAVVISDLRMPDMSGIDLLCKVKELSPDTVRVLLTGQADVDNAIAAVNEGNVFRFLMKPCPEDVLTGTLDEALSQYQMVTAQRNVLHETLIAVISVLMNVLGEIQPAAFGRAERIRQLVIAIANATGVKVSWELEAAALLSQVGFISVPPEIVAKYHSGDKLSEEERDQISREPEMAGRLLQGIPRLRSVLRIIAAQQDFSAATPRTEDAVVFEAGQILCLAQDFDHILRCGISADLAVGQLEASPLKYSAELLSALRRIGRTLPLPEEYRAGNLCFRPAADELPFGPLAQQVLRGLRDHENECR